MTYNFPETRFVRENFMVDQLDHVISEAKEAADAYLIGTGMIECAEELLDTIHSAETALRILCAMRPDIDMEGLRAQVIAKNRARGYYI